MTVTPGTRENTLELAQALADVGASDTEYRNFYLRRAREILAPVMSREALEGLRSERARLAGLPDGARRAVEAGDWKRVRELAVALRAAERRLGETEHVITAAERVYDADTGISREALAAYAVSPLPASELQRIQTRVAAQLEQLAARDAEWSAFYRARRVAVESLPVESRPEPAGAAEETLREEAREAVRAGRWEALVSLAENLGGARSEEADGCTCGPLPDGPRDPGGETPTSEAAARYGLVEVRLDSCDDIRAFLNCRCAMAPRLSEQALTDEDPGKRSTACGCGDRCPELEERLRENLDLLKHRAFLTSLGTRYLPTFPKEVVLLETFPETSAERGPLLERLRLPKRLGLSRIEIEQALALDGADVVESLGLDPMEHILVPVPFDVYFRAAAQLGWGQRPHWTHLDGYQVLRGWRLRAMVGGNARYGGPADLCTIGRDDPRDDVLVRFCVLRRRHLQEHVRRSDGGEHSRKPDAGK